MSSFIKSFFPLLKRLKIKKYLVEIILLSTALIITITAVVIYNNNSQSLEDEVETSSIRSRQNYDRQEQIFVDVSGAVNKPNMYQVGFGARLKNVIDKASGLSDDADVMFFNRNFNLARIVYDQEKIYIPSILEIKSGIVMESPQTFDYNSPSVISQIKSVSGLSEAESLININSATIEELDQLPGIGQVTANKIITNRPYNTMDELLTNKVVNKGVYEKIKDLIVL